MRDIILVFIFPILLIYCFRQPAVTLFLTVWTSLVPMANWTFGFADNLRLNFVFSIILIFQFITKKLIISKPDKTGLVLFILFIIHFTTSSLINNKNDFQADAMIDYLKSCILGFIIIYTCGVEKNLRAVLLGVVLSISYFASKEAALYITSSGTYKLEGIIGSLSDNNKFALAAVCSMPILIYLYNSYKITKLHILFFACLILGTVVSIVASSSRGAFLALAAYILILIIKSQNKVKLIYTLCFLIPIALVLASDNWFARMNTIQNAGEDLSFIGRINAWKISYLIASEHPLLGGGIDAVNFNWYEYRELVNTVTFFGITPLPERGYVAHSIYFEVLGNQGFLGFILAAALIIRCFINIKGKIPDYEAIKYSFIVFLIGGAALSFFYSQLCIILICLALSKKKI